MSEKLQYANNKCCFDDDIVSHGVRLDHGAAIHMDVAINHQRREKFLSHTSYEDLKS